MTLIVPVFNDRANAEAFCHEFIKSELEDARLLLVDNGSEDNERLQHLSDLAPGKIVVSELRMNQGYGGGVQHGLKLSQSDWVAWLPGNMKVRPSEIRKFLSFVKSQQAHTMVKAIRSGRKPLPKVKTFLASVGQSLVAGRILYDTGGTPTAVHRDNPIVPYLLSGPKDYSFESFAAFIAKLKGTEVKRFRVPYGSRLFGNSHWQSGLKSELQLMIGIMMQIPRWREIATDKGMSDSND